MRSALLLTCALIVGCAAPPPPVAASAARPSVDSIVLERTPCFGPCPVYRLRIDGRGLVYFVSPDPKGAGTRATDRVAPWVPDTLAAHARRIGFAELPDDVSTSDELCGLKFTDHPGIRLAIYGASVKHVWYDTGCYVGPYRHPLRTVAPRLAALKELADRIDTLARVGRWVQPHAIR